MTEGEFTEQLLMALEATPSAVYIKDIHTGQYTYTNKRTFPFGLSDKEFLPPEEVEEILANDREAFERGEIIREEIIGNKVWLSTKFRVDDDHIGGVATEITEQKQFEIEVRQMATLESLAELARGMTHDLHHVLGITKNYLKLLERDVAQGAVTKIAEDIDTIRETVHQGEQLVRKISIFGSDDKADLRTLWPGDLIQAAAPLLNFPGVEIALDLTEEVGPALVDPVQMEQVLLNLGRNARDAGATRIRFSTGANGDGSTGFTVADNGAGMSDEVKSKALQPFYTTKERGEGTGLGLSIVYGIVKRAGGDLRIHSIEGEGTEISVTLPLVPG